MLGLTVLCGSIAAVTGAGFWMVRGGHAPQKPRAVLLFVMALLFFAVAFSAASAFAADGEGSAAKAEGNGLGLIGAALSTGLACIGAGIGVAFVGAAALGVVGEKPALFGKTLIYMGLAEGIAIYGIVISLFILAKM
ncbi:MAG: ATP synthase subunit C [Synergistaceae bacterium]|jgi:V/A-type H+-transporting ATPase subunit K|nr:ATP synthase subunit C [Synergistaceae bacterium]